MCRGKLDCVVENQLCCGNFDGKKERKEESKLFVLRDARQFVYPRIMDGSGHLDGGGSTSGNGDYEWQAMSSWVHDSTCETTS